MTLQKYLCRPAWQARVGRRTNGALVLPQKETALIPEREQRVTCHSAALTCPAISQERRPTEGDPGGIE